ncbi:MAG: hypothetical protein ACREDU_05120, partial [Methylocella sp.]
MAAGSTGSIPAARELLAAIAALPNGAIILPGLDTLMEEESWLELGPQHPQFIMKQFLEDVSVPRNEVALLPGHGPGARSWLAGEIMRPTATSESWLPVVRTQIESISRALADLEAVEARDVSEEASVIALMFRKALTVPGKTASLVTPDRELARRVKQELADCGIEIDDSAGEPLIRIGAATFLGLLIDAVAGECAPQKLLALFKHELCNFGFDADAARNAVSTIELAVFRGSFIPPHPAELAKSVSDARNLIRLSSHVHPAIARKTEADWKVAADYAEKVSECVVPLVEAGDRPLAMHLDMLVRSCELAAGPAFWEGEEAEPLRLLVEDIQREAGTIASCSFKSAAFFLWHRLQVTPFRGRARPPTRLSILGLLEARLSRPDVVILGGLNEGRWPASPDSGPWLSRPMREKLGMQLPERNIGQTAHDFAQGLGCREAYLTWSRRIGNAPAIPSRWILRLRILVKAAGLIGRLETGQW